jgi:hypothetical protein
VSDFPIVLSNGPPPAGFQAVADAGVTMIRAGRGDWNEASLDAQIAANQKFRSIAVTGGAFRDWFAAHDARVYRFRR